MTKAPDWHGLVAWDMLFNNMTTGLFLVAAIGDLIAPDLFTPIAKIAYPIALVLLLVDLGCLVSDLGDPLRFHHMLRIFKPTSPMSLGTWCLTVYSFPLTLIAALSLFPAPESDGVRIALEGVRTTAVILAILPALGSALYKGVLLSTTAQPGWKDARWLGAYFTHSAILLGCAEMLALAVLMVRNDALAILRPALLALYLTNTLFLFLLLDNLRLPLKRIYLHSQLWSYVTLLLGAWLILPVCLILADSPALLLAAVLLMLLGSLVIRYIIVRIPHALTQHEH